MKTSKQSPDFIDTLILIVWKISIPILLTTCAGIFILGYTNLIKIPNDGILYTLSSLGYMIILFLSFLGSITLLAGIALLFVLWVEGHDNDDDEEDKQYDLG